MFITESSNQFVKSNIGKLKFLRTFNKNEPKHARHGTPDGLTGLYFIFHRGANPLLECPIYIGETIRCIKRRTNRHKKSMNNPHWKGEKTGNLFISMGIDIDKDFDIWYLTASDLGAISKRHLIKAEADFMIYYNLNYEI